MTLEQVKTLTEGELLRKQNVLTKKNKGFSSPLTIRLLFFIQLIIEATIDSALVDLL